MRRLPTRLPQGTDTPASTERLLYKASTGSYKAADMLLSLLELAVVCVLGPEVWEDEAVGVWEVAMAGALPPRPTRAALQRLLDHAHEDGLIPRPASLEEAPPSEEDLTESFRVGMLDRFMGDAPRFDEAGLLASALAAMHADWDGARLMRCATEQAWCRDYKLHRLELVQATLALLWCVRAAPQGQVIERLTAHLFAEDDDPYTVEMWEENLRALGVTERELGRLRSRL